MTQFFNEVLLWSDTGFRSPLAAKRSIYVSCINLLTYSLFYNHVTFVQMTGIEQLVDDFSPIRNGCSKKN